MFLANVGVPGGLFLVAKLRNQKKTTVNILFIGAGNTKSWKERFHLNHWDVVENWFEIELEMVTNPNY